MNMLLEQFKTIFDRPEKVKRLRDLILKLAVRGKLVGQDENDEPASVLLERIKEEKDKLIKEGKIKKSKPLPEISEEEKPYELPEGWILAYMQDITSCVTCGLASTPNYVEDGKIFLSAKNIKPYKFMPENHKFVSEADYIKLTQNSKPEFNDILLTRVGAGIGEAAIIDRDLEFAIYVSLTLIKPIHSQIYAKYLLHWINSPEGVSKSLGNTFGKGVSQGNLNVNQVRKFLIPIPPLNEQKRIVEKVDSLMLLCDNLEKELQRKVKYSSLSSKSVFNSIGSCSSLEELGETLKFIIDNFKELTLGDDGVKELKNAVLQLAVKGKLVPQNPKDESASVLLEKIKEEKEKLIKEKKIKKEKALPEIGEDEKPYELPSGWEWVRLNDVCSLITDGTHSTPTYINTGVPFISVKDISSGVIDFSNTKFISKEEHQLLIKRCNPEYGDILLTKIGTTGIAKVIDTKKEFSIFVSVALLKIFKESVFNKYIEYVINSPFVKKQSEENTQGVGNKNLVLKYIKKFIIPLPPLNEQKRIVEKVDSLMALCDELENKIEKSKKYSETLMEALLKNEFI